MSGPNPSLTHLRRATPALVATLGPASMGLAEPMAEAGATALRLNASHMHFEELGETVERLGERLPELTVILDLQGAKMRLGDFTARPLRIGERVQFAAIASCGSDAVPLPHAELYTCLHVGETLSLDDDRLRLRVVDVTSTCIAAEVVTGGMLRPRKGVNVVEHPVQLADLSPFDAAVCPLAARLAHGACAFSFMLDGREASWVRRNAPGVAVVGKVERAEAVANLSAIAAATDAIWICRGDLGAQLGPAGLARAVAAVEPRAQPRPVLMAGQVLEHLTVHPVPTRSEVCHLYDLLARGYAGIVLSDETAIGADPVRAVRTAAELMRAFAA